LAAATGACVLLALALPARADSMIEMTGSATSYYFARAYLVVTVDSSVTWLNSTDAEHTVTSYKPPPKGFDSSPQTQSACHNHPTLPGEQATDCVEPGAEVTVRFSNKGTYDYYCKAHGNRSFKPNPKLAANQQPCGMCGTIVVKAEQSAPPVTRSTNKPKSSKSPSPSPSASPSASPSPVPTDSAGNPIVAGSNVGSAGGGGSGGRAVLATFGILALSGIGYAVWRKFLAQR
jgi:plastocyanin